jgi:hypothetical protein
MESLLSTHGKWTVDSPLSTPITTWNPTCTPHPQEKKGRQPMHSKMQLLIGCMILFLKLAALSLAWTTVSLGSVSTLTKTNKFFFSKKWIRFKFFFEITCFSIIYYDIVIQVVKLFRIQPTYDNHDDFHHLNFIFPQNFNSLVWGLFYDENWP